MKKWVFLLLLAVAVWIFWANTAVEINEWTIDSPGLPEAFDGFRIAHISDLHNAQFGEGNKRLLELLSSAEPDIIVITGDLIDSRNTDVETALAFAEEAQKIAPCYYVSGNHEARSASWESLHNGLTGAGVEVLMDEVVPLEIGGERVMIFGLQDPDFGGDFEGTLCEIAAADGYTILLSHRPERMSSYVRSGADLVFSGHAHGGQVRIPFLGGLIAPHQGFFPEYDSGLYRDGNTVMLLSRGLGNSICPLRLNNRPEIIVAVLKRI